MLVAALSGSAFAACDMQVRQGRGTVDVARSLRETNHGGREFSYWISKVAMTDDDARKSILEAISQANEVQKDAIGQGLAIAANECASRDAVVRRKIEDLVRKAGDRIVLRSYLREFSAPDVDAAEKNGNDDLDKHQTLDLVGPIEPVGPGAADPYPLPGRRWFVR
jgi:hypothetical protein